MVLFYHESSKFFFFLFLSFFLITIPFETKNIPPIIREESVEERLDPS